MLQILPSRVKHSYVWSGSKLGQYSRQLKITKLERIFFFPWTATYRIIFSVSLVLYIMCALSVARSVSSLNKFSIHFTIAPTPMLDTRYHPLQLVLLLDEPFHSLFCSLQYELISTRLITAFGLTRCLAAGRKKPGPMLRVSQPTMVIFSFASPARASLPLHCLQVASGCFYTLARIILHTSVYARTGAMASLWICASVHWAISLNRLTKGG